ncbi:MAG: hypothetical protein IK076_04245, partial [Bacteroidales bacterium]|nr:hypothetical protein [Bacteroidales bacterium]
VLERLQVRPVAAGADFQTSSIEEAAKSVTHHLVKSDSALGNGWFNESEYLVIIPPECFDKMRTEDMVTEISGINTKIAQEGKSYILICPGRWGSSIPTLGVPVIWSDISVARMVVEYSIQDFRIEPSQGTHFFQNITSMGIGYLSVDQYAGNGSVDFEAIAANECIWSGEYVKVYRIEGLTGFIDRNKGKSIIGF